MRRLLLVTLLVAASAAAEVPVAKQGRLYGICAGAKPFQKPDGVAIRCPSSPADGSQDTLMIVGCRAVAAKRSPDGNVLAVTCNGGAVALFDSRPASAF